MYNRKLFESNITLKVCIMRTEGCLCVKRFEVLFHTYTHLQHTATNRVHNYNSSNTKLIEAFHFVAINRRNEHFSHSIDEFAHCQNNAKRKKQKSVHLLMHVV